MRRGGGKMAAIAAAAAASADDDAAPGETVTCFVGSKMHRAAFMADEHAQGPLKNQIQFDRTHKVPWESVLLFSTLWTIGDFPLPFIVPNFIVQGLIHFYRAIVEMYNFKAF